jgi:hypothetical protein
MSIPKMPMGAPYQYNIDLPNSGVQLHMHGPNSTTLTGGYLKTYSGEVATTRYLNGYECAMADLYASNLELNRK